MFVEEFILDRTLEPAIEEFGLEGLRMIDPACGSGHFLLGSLHRILEKWQRQAPAIPILELAQRALNSVYGVDINPYAVAIARFRLLLAVLQECGVKKLKNAPAFKINLACGDSLLHGTWMQLDLDLGEPNPNNHYFQVEDRQTLTQILEPKTYHAVVANPPYITPKDKALNQAYRQRYSACHMKYSLAVPFMERIFELAVPSGFTGQITANSFMKREFGKKLIEEFFPKVDLTHVIDTSGAYIPGHGTPTVILLGRNRQPVASTIRTVMGIRGEPRTPDNAREGLVWTAIVSQVDIEGSESDFVSVANSDRALFHKHPWSIGGGGASNLKTWIDSNNNLKLAQITTAIGITSVTGEDELFMQPLSNLKRQRIENTRFLIEGDVIRDWQINSPSSAIWLYNDNFELLSLEKLPNTEHLFWQFRAAISHRKRFGTPMIEKGLTWYEWQELYKDKLYTPLTITFAFVASHNHFVLDRGGKVFKQSAPVIKLAADATEDDHLALLGLLNSSTACFWMKQVSQQKQLTGGDGVRVETIAKVPYEFAGTQLKKLPLPQKWQTSPLRHHLIELTRNIEQLAQELRGLSASNAIEKGLKAGEKVTRLWNYFLEQRTKIRSQLIFLQEEIDFVCYCLYELADESLLSPESLLWDEIIDAGDRPFCIIKQHNQEGFTVPPDVPRHWSEELQAIWQKRISAIKKSKSLKIIEDPHYKRRWIGRQGLFNHTKNTDELASGCETWLLNKLESYFDFDGRMDETGNPTAKIDISLISIAKLADIARKDPEFMEIGELYRQDNAFDVQKLVQELVEKESVPLLPVLRYKPSGLRKRQEWEKTWDLQRLEDTIDARTKLDKDNPNYLDFLAAEKLKTQEIGKIPVPAKYTSKDFLKQYWRLRGKLDVPKERWVSFPHCEGEDGTLVIAWAGYSHLQLAQSISAYFVEIQERIGGSADFRLQPLLGCLLELLPWLKQWHNDIDPEYDLRMGDYFAGFIQEEARRLDKTPENILNWQPPKQKTRKRKK
ncbi:MAG: BREX-2 system adenine-specific DNA-methyltransferase PglX [Xenococcaceae cyanobacterium]